jgi:hypothetical protein
MSGIGSLADRMYTTITDTVYEKGISLQESIETDDVADPNVREMLKDQFGVFLAYLGGSLMPRARQVALTPVRVPGTYRLRRQG